MRLLMVQKWWMMKSYSELIELPTFEDRFRYLQCNSSIGSSTLGSLRWLAESFYRTKEWRDLQNYIRLRDAGCDLAIPDRMILGEKGTIHHIKPLTAEDFRDRTMFLLDPEYMILTTHHTHNAIHYGDESLIVKSVVNQRTANDTIPWR